MAPLPRLGKSELLILVSPFASVISQCYTRPNGLLVLQTHTPEYRLAGACWLALGGKWDFSPKSAFSGAARPQFPEGWGPRRSSLPERPRGAVCRPRPRRPPSPDPAAATCPPPRPLASHPSPQAAGRHCSLGAQPRSRQQRRAAPSSSRLPSAMSTLPKSPPWCSAIEMRHFLSASSPALSLPLRCCGSPPAPPTSPPPSPPREHGARTELSR